MRKQTAPLLAMALCVLVGIATTASAAEVWSVDSGRTTLYLNQDVLAKAGLTVSAAGTVSDTIGFDVSPAELFLDNDDDAAIQNALESSPLRHEGTIEFITPDGLHIGAGFSLNDSGSMLIGGERVIDVNSSTGAVFVDINSISISRELASALGDPSLEGLVIGSAESDMLITYRRGAEMIDGLIGDGELQYYTTSCQGSFGPDVIVGDLPSMGNYPAVGGIEAYSVATTSCNMGTQNLLWFSGNSNHPVICQNIYRFKALPNGVTQIEQIGLGWLKHGFAALALNLCCTCNNPGTQTLLGVGCSDPYSSGLNGQQGWPSGGLGPRFEVNAHTGAFPYPYTFRGQTGNGIYKRIQVKISDIDNNQDGGGLYFVEGHYVTPDDAANFNQNNNASYRQITIAQGSWNASPTGSTHREEQAIRAWKANDVTVKENEILTLEADSNKGLVILCSDVTDLGGGTWHYEYAVYNMNSDRSISSISVPVADTVNVTNIGFHDVDYHDGDGFGSTSGSPVNFDGTDWPAVHMNGKLTWSTDDFNTNPNANAIRWGTTYNFRFDADQPPITAAVELGYYKPGPTSTISTNTNAPMAPPVMVEGDFDGDGDADAADFAIFSQCFGGSENPPAATCPPGVDADLDGDGDVDAFDFVLFGQFFTGAM